MVHLQGFLGGDDAPGDLLPDGLGVGAGGEDHVAAGDATAVNLDGVGSHQAPPALDQIDAPRGDQALKPLVHPRDDAVLVLLDTRHVHALEGGLDTDRGGLAHGVSGLGGVQQGLGGYAAAVEAGASQLVGLDEGDLEASWAPRRAAA